MHINNFTAEKGSQVNIAETINSISYEKSGINSDDLDSLKKLFKTIEPDYRKELRQKCEDIINSPSDQDQQTLINKLKDNMQRHGIAISQSLTAAGIFEILKLLL